MKKIKFIFLIFTFYSVLGISQEIGDVSIKANNSISGKIHMGDNALVSGEIFLISNSKSNFSTSGNSSVKEGKFNFDNVDLSEFSLYVIPNNDYDFFYFPKYLPTYLGDVCYWQKASIYNKQNNRNLNIHLNKYTEPFYGSCEVSGIIQFEDLNSINETPVVVFLLNSDKVPMDFRKINKGDGTFVFEYLPEGKYFIHVEIPGFDSDDIEINIKSQNLNDVSFRVKENSIEQEYKDDGNNIDPIVTKEGVKFFINADNTSPVVCELNDLSGRLILKKKFLTNEIFMSTSNVATGIYLLRARTYTNSLLKTTKVYINNN